MPSASNRTNYEVHAIRTTARGLLVENCISEVQLLKSSSVNPWSRANSGISFPDDQQYIASSINLSQCMLGPPLVSYQYADFQSGSVKCFISYRLLKRENPSSLSMWRNWLRHDAPQRRAKASGVKKKMKTGTRWQYGLGHVSIEYYPHDHLVLEKFFIGTRKKERKRITHVMFKLLFYGTRPEKHRENTGNE